MMHIQVQMVLTILVGISKSFTIFIGGFGVAGGGVAYMAHIGGFAIGFATGYLYKKCIVLNLLMEQDMVGVETTIVNKE